VPETLAVRLFAAVSMMVPSPPSVASTSRAMSWRSCAVPSLIATSSFVAVPPASMLPLPGSSMVTLRLSIPVTEMFPSPRRLRRSREGTLTDTNIGLLALRLPGVVPMTSLPSALASDPSEQVAVPIGVRRVLARDRLAELARADLQADG
jgi:hypothetical protein